MAVPVLVGAGALSVVNTGSGDVTKTGVTVGNVIMLHSFSDATGVSTNYNSATGVESIAGVASSLTGLILDFAVGSPGAGTHTLYAGRATSTTVTVNVTDNGGDRYSIIWEFSGAGSGTTTGTLFDDIDHGEGTGTTITDVAVTTSGTNRLALNFIAVGDDNQTSFDTEAFTGQTGGTWVCGGGFGSSTGTDGALGLQYAEMPSAGTIDGGSLTMASDPWGVYGCALIGTAGVAMPPVSIARPVRYSL